MVLTLRPYSVRSRKETHTLKSNPLRIGQVSLNGSSINREFLEATQKAVEASKVRKGKAAALRALQAWTPETPLEPEQLEQIEAFSDLVHDKFSDLEDKWWDDKKSDSPSLTTQQGLEERMGLEGQFLIQQQKLKKELREANSRSAVMAMSGTLVGAPGIVAAYAAYANPSDWSGPETENVKAILAEVQALADGTSEMVTESNAVTQVHRDKLWKSINDLLDESIDQGEAGKPTELDLQYYELTSAEIIAKIARSAKAGNKVRVNLDAGRLSFPSRDREGENYFSLDATPDKLRTIIQLASLRGADIGVSLFPQKKNLNSATDLMHRKVVRVGDKVLISGMNANLGSGENIDSGYIVEGKAAAKLADNVARDIQSSKGATLEEIWGQSHIEKFQETNLRLGKRGIVSLLDSVAGPSKAGSPPPKVKSLEALEKLAKKAKVKLSDLFEVEDYEKELSKMITGRNQLQLSSKGKKLLESQIERAIELTNTPKNLKRLDDMESPSTAKAGKTRVDIADAPVEREALVIAAISEAEEYILLPGFVVTRAVAAALVAKRDQMREQGKEIDIKVIADSGIYPHGGNPNSYGVKLLEDHGIQPRWAKLERTGSHDRKIHAKQLITDQGEITGSTNFSTRGLRQNWETSAYIHFDSADEESLQARQESLTQFEELWASSYELNTKDHSDYLNRDKPELGREWFVEDGRDRSVKHILRLIGNYERESGKINQDILAENPKVAARKAKYQEQGYSYGDATLKAIDDVLGEKAHDKMLENLKTTDTLRMLQTRVLSFHNGAEAIFDDADSTLLEDPKLLLF